MTNSQPSGADPTWDGPRAEQWLANADAREAQFVPVSAALFERAALRPGERVLDVGVGTGSTTAAAFEAVQPGGSVTGIDISRAMIAAARERVRAAGIDWVQGDVTTHEFPAAAYDAVISRFGVMFFSDPVTAFRRMHDATVPGGRFVATVWARRDASLFAIPYTVVTTTLHRLGVEYRGIGPDESLFSLGDPDTAHRVLATAGWTEIDSRANQRTLYLGGGGDSVASTVSGSMGSGPISALLAGQSPEVLAAVRTALTADFERRHDGTGVGLPAGFVVLSAVRP